MNDFFFSNEDFNKPVRYEDRLWALILVGIAEVSLNSSNRPIISYNLNDIPNELFAWKDLKDSEGFNKFNKVGEDRVEVYSDSKDLTYFYEIYSFLCSSDSVTNSDHFLKQKLMEEMTLTAIIYWNTVGTFKNFQFKKAIQFQGSRFG